MKSGTKIVVGVVFIGLGLGLINLWRNQGGCINGETKTLDCNSCFCSGGQWACTMMACPDELPIRPIQFQEFKYIESVEDERRRI